MTSSQQSPTISAAFPYEKQRLRVLGHDMAYVEVGQGVLPSSTVAKPPEAFAEYPH